jgi:hypothetical protein
MNDIPAHTTESVRATVYWIHFWQKENILIVGAEGWNMLKGWMVPLFSKPVILEQIETMFGINV